jgi:phage shock protein C
METTASATSPRRLYKSRRERMIDGVCGGIAEYFEVDATIVRILWVLVTLLGGSGFILYIIAMIIMPVNPEHIGGTQPAVGGAQHTDRKRFWGVLLILVGALILFTNLGLFAAFRWWHVSWDVVFPVALIIIGAWLMYVHANKPDGGTHSSGSSAAENGPPTAEPRRELKRSATERKLFGVCAGIAKYFNVDPTIVRVLYVLLVLASFGWGLLLYIILAILVPEEKLSTTSG